MMVQHRSNPEFLIQWSISSSCEIRSFCNLVSSGQSLIQRVHSRLFYAGGLQKVVPEIIMNLPRPIARLRNR
ncbi:hypothetical protein SETIT_3G297200v2 [Setaria italica]|uniref:Uncharacterized protein n=1 Tax=Setaria italica TaxID=4555 RepID=A0A368QK99_SETIT|nr:hypothetical protein SETIT_3G297200v2 [Setaria italica]